MINFRTMQITDYQDCYALWQSLPGIGLSGADEKEQIEAFLERNPELSLLAVADGKLVGTILCGQDGRRGYLHHLAVHKNFQRRGIGRELVSRCQENLHRLGIQKIHIFVKQSNCDAKMFWQKLHFEAREDICMMSKEINR